MSNQLALAVINCVRQVMHATFYQHLKFAPRHLKSSLAQCRELKTHDSFSGHQFASIHARRLHRAEIFFFINSEKRSISTRIQEKNFESFSSRKPMLLIAKARSWENLMTSCGLKIAGEDVSCRGNRQVEMTERLLTAIDWDGGNVRGELSGWWVREITRIFMRIYGIKILI